MTTFDAAQARAAADEITRRIHNDEDLAKRLRSNPAETLIEFGVPADVADRVVSTVGAPSEDDAPEHDPRTAGVHVASGLLERYRRPQQAETMVAFELQELIQPTSCARCSVED
jgi:hypothetical protein